MTSEYRRVLYTWAKREVPDAAVIEDVQFAYDTGGAYSSVTFEDPSFSIVVHYRTAAGERKTEFLDQAPGLITMGGLLKSLFEIAEAEGS